jgi:hypothetical protein
MAPDVRGAGPSALMHNHMAEFTAQVLKNEVPFLCAIISVTYCYDKSVQCMLVYYVWLFVKCSGFVPTQHSCIYRNVSS